MFVATFVGSPTMNIVPATQAGSGRVRASRFELPAPSDGEDAEGLRLGVRPEHVEVVSAGGQDPEATVERVERAGSEVFVEVVLADGVALMVRVPADSRPAPGERVGVRLDERRLHYFDAAGNRVGDV
jgi:ABC-type sugar transport system ATPase subunit